MLQEENLLRLKTATDHESRFDPLAHRVFADALEEFSQDPALIAAHRTTATYLESTERLVGGIKKLKYVVGERYSPAALVTVNKYLFCVWVAGEVRMWTEDSGGISVFFFSPNVAVVWTVDEHWYGGLYWNSYWRNESIEIKAEINRHNRSSRWLSETYFTLV